MLSATADVIRCGDLPTHAVDGLLARYGLGPVRLAPGAPIPASHWGAPEAGLRGDRIYLRPDTPLHSMLHETCHYICMDTARRDALDTDAGGDDLEEAAVCYLQVLLADRLPGYSRARLFADMDAWGYSFRLGDSARWFAEDATDARRWLDEHGIIDRRQLPTWRLRD